MGYIDDVDATVAVANNTRKEKSYSSATDARPGDELEIEVAGANLSMTADVALHLDLAIVRTGAGTVDVTSTLSTKSGQQTTSHCLIVAEVGRLPEVRFTPKSRIRFKATNEDGAPVLIPLSVPSGVHLSVDLPLILHNGSAGNFTLTVYVTVAH
jgi:hypothetical protein